MEDFDIKRTAIKMLKDSKLFTEKELDYLIHWSYNMLSPTMTPITAWSPAKAGVVLGNRSANNIQSWCKTFKVSKDFTNQFWIITAPDLIAMKIRANELDNR